MWGHVGPPFDSVQLVNISPISLWFMDVYGTYNYSIHRLIILYSWDKEKNQCRSHRDTGPRTTLCRYGAATELLFQDPRPVTEDLGM